MVKVVMLGTIPILRQQKDWVGGFVIVAPGVNHLY